MDPKLERRIQINMMTYLVELGGAEKALETIKRRRIGKGAKKLSRQARLYEKLWLELCKADRWSDEEAMNTIIRVIAEDFPHPGEAGWPGKNIGEKQ